MGFLRWIGRVLGLLPGLAEKTAQLIVKVSAEALPVVKLIASLTPTRADDELIALFERFAVPRTSWWLGLAPGERGAALLHVATVELQRRFPDVPIRVLHAAIHLALASEKR